MNPAAQDDQNQLRELEFLSGIVLRIQDDLHLLKSFIAAKYGEFHRSRDPATVNIPSPSPHMPMSVMSSYYRQCYGTQGYFGYGFGQDIRNESCFTIGDQHQRENIFNGLNNVGQNALIMFNADANNNFSNHGVIVEDEEDQMMNTSTSSSVIIDVVGISTTADDTSFEELATDTDGDKSPSTRNILKDESITKVAASSSLPSTSTTPVAFDKKKRPRKQKLNADAENILKRIKIGFVADKEALGSNLSKNCLSSNSQPCSSSKGEKETHRQKNSHQQPKDEHACNICKKKFIFRSYLLQHLETHSRAVFGCSLCPNGYSSRKNLKVHLSTNHANAKISPDDSMTKCRIKECDFKVKSFTAMLTHFEEVHNGIECQYCRKIIFKRTHFNRHLREQHFLCCSTQFLTKSELLAHRSKNHSKKKRPKAVVVV